MNSSTENSLFKDVCIVDERLFALTQAAAKQIKTLIEREQKGAFLRITVTGGGCNGLSYKLKFVEGPKGGDLAVQSLSQWLLIDPKSALYLKGTTLDYSDELLHGGFVFKNPNAQSSCSCGESFQV